MMKVIIVSDTHGNNDFVDKIVSKYPKADKFLHAGDSCCNEYMISPFKTVRGNCDYYVDNIYRIIEVNDVRIFMFHGDRFNLSIEALVRLSKDYNCNVIIHGHTHKSGYTFSDGVHIICPGSLYIPRGGVPSYAVMEFTSYKDIKVEIKKYGN